MKPLNQFELIIERVVKQRNQKKSIHWLEDMLIDGQSVKKGALNYAQLVESLCQDGEFFIFTCGCGEPGCADIYDGVSVRHVDGKTFWCNKHVQPNKEYVFESRQYRESIYHGLLAASRLITRKSGQLPIGVTLFDYQRLEACLKEAAAACANNVKWSEK